MVHRESIWIEIRATLYVSEKLMQEQLVRYEWRLRILSVIDHLFRARTSTICDGACQKLWECFKNFHELSREQNDTENVPIQLGRKITFFINAVFVSSYVRKQSKALSICFNCENNFHLILACSNLL